MKSSDSTRKLKLISVNPTRKCNISHILRGGVPTPPRKSSADAASAASAEGVDHRFPCGADFTRFAASGEAKAANFTHGGIAASAPAIRSPAIRMSGRRDDLLPARGSTGSILRRFPLIASEPRFHIPRIWRTHRPAIPEAFGFSDLPPRAVDLLPSRSTRRRPPSGGVARRGTP